MTTLRLRTFAAAILLSLPAAAARAQAPAFQPPPGWQLMMDDPLQGSTKGIRNGGAFQNGGWEVTGLDNWIIWHFPTIKEGAVTFSVKGLFPNECRAGFSVKGELFHMYDYTFGDSDDEYNGGYRENPFKHFMRKNNCMEGHDPPRIDGIEMLFATGNGNFMEPDTANLSWDPTKTYVFREEWGPDGSGNVVMKTWRDDEQIIEMSLPGEYAPVGLSVRIAASPRAWPEEETNLGSVYSNIKVWNTSGTPITAAAPPEPGGGTGPNQGAAADPTGGLLTGGLTGGLTGTGGINPWNNISTLSSYTPTQTTPATPPPQYTTAGNNPRATYVSGGADDSSSGGGGGGGGCFMSRAGRRR